MGRRWVVLDVGETLIDETRVWTLWADLLGVPRLTFMAAFGGIIARGGEHRDIFGTFGATDWHERWPAHEALYEGFQADDLYPDALPAMEALRKRGYRLAVIGNQPASRTEQLRALGVDAEVIAMSAEMGVSKPAPAFFDRTLELLGLPDPASVAYVGDRRPLADEGPPIRFRVTSRAQAPPAVISTTAFLNPSPVASLSPLRASVVRSVRNAVSGGAALMISAARAVSTV